MESYLVDPAVLGEFVDTLIAEKYPDGPAEKYAGIREESVKALDHQILKTILGTLTKEQGAKLSRLLDDQNTTEQTFADFFKNNNIDLEAALRDTMVNFRETFLKGANNAES